MRLEVRTTIGWTAACDGAALGNGDLEVGQEFEQQRLEFVIGAVDLVDEQQPALGRLQNLEQGTRDQEAIVVDIDFAVARLADGEKLTLIVPFVERVRGIDALIALQPDEIAAQSSLRCAFAASVLPTPGAPSSSSGLPSRMARKMAVASPSSAR